MDGPAPLTNSGTQDVDTHIHHHCRQDEDMNDMFMLMSRHSKFGHGQTNLGTQETVDLCSLPTGTHTRTP